MWFYTAECRSQHVTLSPPLERRAILKTIWCLSSTTLTLLSLKMYKIQYKHTPLSAIVYVCRHVRGESISNLYCCCQLGHYEGGKLHKKGECVKEAISSY